MLTAWMLELLPVSAIIQELSLSDQKAQYMISLALPWDRWMDNSNAQVGSTESRVESHRIRDREGKPVSGWSGSPQKGYQFLE